VQKIYLVVGCPGSGKSFVCDQLKDDYQWVPHDDYVDSNGRQYVPALVSAARAGGLPVLGEAPYSLSQLMKPLQEYGLVVEPVFIIEDPDVIRERYRARAIGLGHPEEKWEIPVGHLTRQITYEDRAEQMGAFQGTADEVLNYLRTQIS
jgi:hypothetical protein